MKYYILRMNCSVDPQFMLALSPDTSLQPPTSGIPKSPARFPHSAAKNTIQTQK